jgi:predicted outer membrane repeat protein
LFNSDNSNIEIIDSLFDSNNSTSGGGVFFTNNNDNIIISNSTFINNHANDGAAMTFISNNNNILICDSKTFNNYEIITFISDDVTKYFNKSVNVDDCDEYILNFDSNTVIGFEDFLTITDNNSSDILFEVPFLTPLPLYPGISLPSLKIHTSGFGFTVELTRTTLDSNDVAYVKLYVIPVIKHNITSVVIENNVASNNAGGVYFNSLNQFAVLLNLNLTNNKALNGAGLCFVNSNVGTVLMNINFLDNQAINDAGAIYFSTSMSGNSIYNSSFSNNIGKNGGAVLINSGNGFGLLSSGNEIKYEFCNFENNQALGGGGAIYVSILNSVIFKNNYFSNNIANNSITPQNNNNGGGLLLNQDNRVSFISCRFNFNKASNFGGAFTSLLDNNLYISNSSFNSNYAAASGGATFIQSSIITYDNDNTYQDNACEIFGGGISYISCNIWTLTDNSTIKFISNYASSGSAIFFTELNNNNNDLLHDLIFINNIASEGGTVYWLYDETMLIPPRGISSLSIIWENNVALYGNKTATQATQIISPKIYNVNVYDESLSPSIMIYLKDYYGNILPLTGVTSIVPSIVKNSDHCFDRFPFISGNDVTNPLGVLMNNGAASFENLDVFCAPKGNLTLSFIAKLGNYEGFSSQIASKYYISNKSILLFRDCLDGEFQKDGQCLPCPDGSYSL